MDFNKSFLECSEFCTSICRLGFAFEKDLSILTKYAQSESESLSWKIHWRSYKVVFMGYDGRTVVAQQGSIKCN